MKKLLIALMVLALMAGFVYAEADRTITHKMKVVAAANTVVSAQGTVLYRVTGYASSSNAVYGIYDAATLGTCTATTVKVEGGEATQYDSLTTIDFGKEGIPLDTGLSIVTTTATVVVEYL
jgi:hypothetical protein